MTQTAPQHRTRLFDIPPRASLMYTPKFSKDYLDSLRLRGDPIADQVATCLHSKHGGLTNIHDLLTTVRQKAGRGKATPDTEVLRAFLDASGEIPEWADPTAIERGQRVHAFLYPLMGVSLFAGSLVGSGQFVTAAVVTSLAGNITTNPTRRIDETGALLAALAFPGSLLRPGGEAHDSLTRVRLLHGALRHWLPRSGRLKHHRNLVPARVYVEGEVPINQQDLAITLGVFCYLNLRSLRRMGVVLRASDIRAYVHMWRYAGHVLGIAPKLLPLSLEDQEAFMLASMLHQGAPEAVPAHATQEFVRAFARAMSKLTRRWVPEERLQSFWLQVIIYLAGEENVSVGVPDLGPRQWSVRLLRMIAIFMGTLVPRYVPGGEWALFKLHTWGIRRQLNKRGTPTGHAAGTGIDLTKFDTSDARTSKL